MQISFRRPLLFKVMAIFLAFFLCLFLIEIGFRTYFQWQSSCSWLKVGYCVAPQARNEFTFGEGNCPFEEEITLDPDFAYVWNKSSTCLSQRRINRLGLEGDEFPDLKKEDEINVLLLGGSVAHQLGGYPFLKNEIQKKYPNKKVKLLLGAHGSWRLHQNVTLLSRYIRQVDIIIMLNGFNEMVKLMNPDYRFELPTIEYSTVLNKKSSLSLYLTAMLYKGLDGVERNHFMHFWSSGAFLIKRIRLKLIDKLQNTDGKTQLEARYLLDEKLERSQKFNLNLEQMKHYYRLSHLIAKNFKVPLYIFIQPVPALDKELDPVEKSIVNAVKYLSVDEYKTIYHGLNQTLLDMRKEHLPIYSLVNLFSKVKGQRYADHVHLNEKGYEEMSLAITSQIQKTK